MNGLKLSSLPFKARIFRDQKEILSLDSGELNCCGTMCAEGYRSGQHHRIWVREVSMAVTLEPNVPFPAVVGASRDQAGR